MKVSSNYWQDVRKYFQGTYITLPAVHPHHLLYVESVGPDGMKLSDLTANETGFVEFTETPYELQSPLATRRAYFQRDTENAHNALLISRMPARMWKKGIHSENTVIQALNGTGLGGNIMGTGTLRDFVEKGHVFASEFPANFAEYTSLALSPLWAAQNKGGAQDGILYALTHPVGNFSLKKKRLFLLKEFSKLPLPPQLSSMNVEYV